MSLYPSISGNDLHIHDSCCSLHHSVADVDFAAAVVAAAQVYEAFPSAIDCHCSVAVVAAAAGLLEKQ